MIILDMIDNNMLDILEIDNFPEYVRWLIQQSPVSLYQ